MAEGGAGTCPQVFVVDSQASYIPLPSGKSPRWAGVGQRLLLLLVGLAVFGLIVEGFFLYKLYNKTEALSLCLSFSVCQNLTSTKTSAPLGGTVMSHLGAEEMNETPRFPTGRAHLAEIQRKPSAHLLGSSIPVGEDKIVQWTNNVGDAFTFRMDYNNGHLLVQQKGYYYLYSKVHLNAAEECSPIKHKVMKATMAYEKSMELMKSISFHCHTPKSSSTKDQKDSDEEEDLWNSFLGGVFYLQSSDKIFVTLEDGRKMRPGPADNFMGAFMISSSAE
ncbi:hypothetical protein LDENG_00235780 [Lucifuga dentata]|nr:hypothetical protein LDENG_00235780 [Lucifuga dentata]